MTIKKPAKKALRPPAFPPKDPIASILAERGDRYGDFHTHAIIAQDLQDKIRTARNGLGWANLSPVQRQALTVIADKIARMLNGDPDYDDNWKDIQGYARLAEQDLNK